MFPVHRWCAALEQKLAAG